MLGKTFKGLTDEMLAWQTEQLLRCETGPRRATSSTCGPSSSSRSRSTACRRSTRYPGGVALRFARVRGYRPDKRPDEADTIETVRAIFAGGIG